MTDPVILFREAMAATFGPLDFLPIPDGEIHRFHVPGDRAGSRNGAYALYQDGIASGWFGSWKMGSWQIWNSRRPVDHLEEQLVSQRIEQARRQREAEQHKRQQATADEASAMWTTAAPAATTHPYLLSKDCQPHNLRQQGGVLLVPLYLERQLVNLQRIHPDGTKRFMGGGRVTGAYSPLGVRLEPGQHIYICEGWATGATIHEYTGAAVACAMNAGNLLPVGDRLRLAYPDNPLIIAGDDDRQTKGNPGRTAAERAARALGCELIFPPWRGDEPLSLSDFNDLYLWRKAKK